MPDCFSARRTSIGAPSPTMFTTSDIGSGGGAVALDHLADRFGDVARRIDQRAVEIEDYDHVASNHSCMMPRSVLLSGGLDSAVLAAHEAQTARVLPVYVSVGLAWEDGGSRDGRARCCARRCSRTATEPLTRVEFTMRDVYPPTHWAIRGVPPAYDTPDEDVYLTGRNLVLLTKAGVVAARHDAHRIALGPLAGNPFPDARPAFFSTDGRGAVARPRSRDRDRDAVPGSGKRTT